MSFVESADVIKNCQSSCPFDCLYSEGTISSQGGVNAIGCPSGINCDGDNPPPPVCSWLTKNINPDTTHVPTKAGNCPPGTRAIPTLWKDALANGAYSSCDCCFGTGIYARCNPACVIPKLCAPIDPHTDSLNNTTKLNCCQANLENPVESKCGPGWCPNGKPCADFMTKYCQENGYGESCISYLANTTNQQYKTQVINGILQHLYPGNININSNTDPANKVAVDLCKLQPGACDAFLKERCAWVKDTKDIEDDDKVMELCGCFLSDDIYNKDYANLAKPPLPKVCTPPCTYPDAISPGEADVSGEGMHFETCKRHICVMDNITVTIINSKVIGDINFEMLCGGISDASSCYFSDIAVSEIDSKLEGKVKFDVDCNNSCFRFDHNNPLNTTRVDCKTFKPYGNKSTCNKSCKDDDDCPDGYCPICSEGKCRARPYSKNCQSSGDCMVGENCVDGKCIKICASNKDCDEGYNCVNGSCLFACKNDKECDAGMSCINGYCLPSPTGRGCQHDDQCPTGYRCNEKGKCVKEGNGNGGKGGNGKTSHTTLIIIVSVLGGLLFIAGLIFLFQRIKKLRLRKLKKLGY